MQTFALSHSMTQKMKVFKKLFLRKKVEYISVIQYRWYMYFEKDFNTFFVKYPYNLTLTLLINILVRYPCEILL